MKALLKTAHGIGNIEVGDITEPSCTRPKDVKIKIAFCGICGTDIHIKNEEYTSNPPVILGHEFCGTVVETGEKVTRFKIGDKVTAENVCIHCDECYACRTGHESICLDRGAQGYTINGGFTEYIVCEEKNIYKLPENISLEEGALFEPLVCATHAVLDQTQIIPGDLVLISGPGPIGLLASQLALAAGGRVILAGTSHDTERFEIAKKFGVKTTVDVTKEDLKKVVMNLSNEYGVDVFLECSGSPKSVESGLDLLKKRGQYTQIGLFGKEIPFNPDPIVLKEINIRGSMSHSYTGWVKSIQLVKEGKINLKPLISSIYKINDWEKGFDDFEKKKGLKILLTP